MNTEPGTTLGTVKLAPRNERHRCEKQSEGDEAEPGGGERDELREGNSLGVPKSNVPVGKLKQREREWLK